MEAKIIEEKQNPLFARKEIILEVKNEVVPSYAEVEKIISEKFSAQPEAIKIRKIDAKFGSNVFTVYANVYSSKEDKDNTETKTKKEREAEKKALEEKSKVEKLAEEAPAETPSEEPAQEETQTEEVKEEEKTE